MTPGENIFYTTGLNYIAPSIRGAQADETVNCSFTITIDNIQGQRNNNDFIPDFNYIRVYSIHRVSLDEQPLARIVADIEVPKNKNTVSFTDTGNIGEVIDSNHLFYVGGEDVVLQTMAIKDATLFYGGITTKKPSITSITDKYTDLFESLSVQSGYKEYFLPRLNNNYYTWGNQMQVTDKGTSVQPYLKEGEHYRLGLQFQYKNGKWSEPVMVKSDYIKEQFNGIRLPAVFTDVRTTDYQSSNIKLMLPSTHLSLKDSDKQSFEQFKKELEEAGYKKVRSVIVLPTDIDRLVLLQGLLCPTVFRYGNRINNSGVYAQSSWFARMFPTPMDRYDMEDIVERNGTLSLLENRYQRLYNINTMKQGTWYNLAWEPLLTPEYRHMCSTAFELMPGLEVRNRWAVSHVDSDYQESKRKWKNFRWIENIEKYTQVNLDNSNEEFRWRGEPGNPNDAFVIDHSVLTFHSPRVEFRDLTSSSHFEGCKLRLVGAALFKRGIADSVLQTSSPPLSDYPDAGFAGPKQTTYRIDSDSAVDGNADINMILHWYDKWDWQGGSYYTGQIYVYPWQCEGQLNGDNLGKDVETALLSHKILANLRISSNTYWLDQEQIKVVSDNDAYKHIYYPVLFDSDQVEITRLQAEDGSMLEYKGNEDLLITPQNQYLFMQGYHYPDIDSRPAVLQDRAEKTQFIKRPVRMKYKSTPHVVIATPRYTDPASNAVFQQILPQLSGGDSSTGVYNGTKYSQNWSTSSIMTSEPLALTMAYDIIPKYYKTSYYHWDNQEGVQAGHKIPDAFFKITKGRMSESDIQEAECILEQLNSDDISESLRISNLIPDNDSSVNIAITWTFLTQLAEGIETTNPSPWQFEQTKPNSTSSQISPLVDNIEVAEPDQGFKWQTVKLTKIYNVTREGLTGAEGEDNDINTYKFTLLNGLEGGDASVIYSTVNASAYNNFNNAQHVDMDPSAHSNPITTETKFFIKDTYPYLIQVPTTSQSKSITIRQAAIKPNDGTTWSNSAYMWIGELYRNPEDVKNAFGGPNAEDSKWIPSSEAISLQDFQENGIEYAWGDTWFQRYDCLKTYPFTNEDSNSIVDIVSSYIETNLNIDGRTDRNRGQAINVNATPLNFNLLNPVYSQQDNFFSYRVLDSTLFKDQTFPNQVSWSLSKKAAEKVDTWASVTLANTLDMPGEKGKITHLITKNDQLFCFQDKQISQILYNSRVQIPVSDGNPIEIANGTRVDGYRVINDTVGCQDKWAICSTPKGIYFIDKDNDAIYRYGESLLNLSYDKGIRPWKDRNGSELQDNYTEWLPMKDDSDSAGFGIKIVYDNLNQDVYFIPSVPEVMGVDGSSLVLPAVCFSEYVDEFTSYMNYEGSPAMFNFGEHLYSIAPLDYSGKTNIYRNGANTTLQIFDIPREYSVSFISNEDPNFTKIFDTIGCYADSIDENDNVTKDFPFNSITVNDSYQSGMAELDNKNVRRKFKKWGINIPRSGNKLLKRIPDRIRDTWAQITLSSESSLYTKPSLKKASLQNIWVRYTI